MNLKDIDQKIHDRYFRKFYKKALVYTTLSKTQQNNFDPFRDTGYKETCQNPLTVKLLPRTLNPESLIFRQMGQTKSGAIEVIVKNNDVNLIKNSEKIVIDSVEYYVYDDSVGNRFQIFDTNWSNYSRVILFRKET